MSKRRTTVAPESDEGVSLGSIVRYVMSHMRMTETKARFSVKQVLRSGIAFKRIEKTASGRYRLVKVKPPGLICKIKGSESRGRRRRRRRNEPDANCSDLEYDSS